MPQDKSPDPAPVTPFVNDLPTSTDALDFTPYVKALTHIVTAPETGTPLTVGIYGPWGSGKTSLMKMVKDRLPEGYLPVWFDAWKYAHEDSLWRALIIRVLSALRKEVLDETNRMGEEPDPPDEDRLKELDDLEASLYRVVEREEIGELEVDWGKLGKAGAKSLARVALHFVPGGTMIDEMLKKAQGDLATDDLNALFDAVRRERQTLRREHIQSLEQFQDRFAKAVASLDRAHDKRLVVFVDDLDRCLPEKAVEVLEAIKLFMDVPGCIFLLGLDRQVIARGIEIKYREIRRHDLTDDEEKRRFVIEGTRYLEKIIQLPFQIPPIEEDRINEFVQGLMPNWPYPGCAKVFAVGLGQSPRRVKRTVNSFLLLWALKEARDLDVTPVRLAKIVAIQQMEPALYDLLKETPRYLSELERFYRDGASESSRYLSAEERQSHSLPDIAPPLVPFSAKKALARLLSMENDSAAPEALGDTAYDSAFFADLKPDQLRLYFTLTRRTEAPELVESPMRSTLLEPQTVLIPEGEFLMGSKPDEPGGKDEKPQHTVELSSYRIGKYPVTNAEYQTFIRATGYSAPRDWDNGEYPVEQGDYPVVHISWSDAVAYCDWLAEQTGKPYGLPTEAQWEKAARGTDGRTYPWGNDWHSLRCNSFEGERGSNSPVNQYVPFGDSPYGVSDMAGNVWEWTRDRYREDLYAQREGTEVVDPEESEWGGMFVLRGGARDDVQFDVRCACRELNRPSYSNDVIGFRVAIPHISES